MSGKKLHLTMIRRTAIFILLLIAADRLIGYWLKQLYFKQTCGDYYQTTYAVRNANQQLLIFGSSRAAHHYVSAIFEKNVHKTTFNLGRDGRNILYYYTIFSQVLSYHHPDMVILDVNPDEFTWKAGKEGGDVMTSALLPYADEPIIYQSIAQKNKPDLVLSKLFWTYPYNSMVMQILGNYYGFLSAEPNIKGFEPLTGSKVSKTEQRQNQPAIIIQAKYDTSLVNAFKNFLMLAKKNNIRCYIVVSPINGLPVNNAIPYLKKITQSYGYPFYDYSSSDMFTEPSLFYDDSHLNTQGAAIFSGMLAQDVKQHLNKVVGDNDRLTRLTK